MKGFIQKNKRIIFTVIILSIILIFFLFINKLRIEYSVKFETLGDKTNKLQEKLIYYKEAELLNPHDIISLKIGKIYDEAGNPEKAERYFNRLSSTKFGLNLIKHNLKNGNSEKAVSIISSIKENDTINYYQSLIISIDDPDKAFDALENKTSEKSKKLRSYLQKIIQNTNKEYKDTAIASFLYNEGYNKLAIRKLEPYSEKNYKEAHVLLGTIYFEQGDYDKSKVAYEKAIKSDPYDIEIYKKLLETYKKLENQEGIKEISDKIDDLNIIQK